MKKTWMKWTMAAMVLAAAVPMTGLAQGRYDRRYDRRESINERQREQEFRIRQGIRSGELTRSEVRRLEAEQARIRFIESRARRDGYVSPRERAYIQRELDDASRNIHREKHDRQDRFRY